MNSRTPIRKFRVHLLPELVNPGDLAHSTVVVVDCLRATTTLTQALEAGARRVLPVLELDLARQMAAELRLVEPALLGGERQGLRPPGFDLGNAPGEYHSDVVGGRTIVFTTTNGTRAVNLCRNAPLVLAGAFVNRLAVARRLSTRGDIDVVCAGTEGEISWEDSLFAGALLSALVELTDGTEWHLGDVARMCQAAWRSVTDGGAVSETLEPGLRLGRGGMNLLAIGRGDDIRWAARLDVSSVVPTFSSADSGFHHLE